MVESYLDTHLAHMFRLGHQCYDLKPENTLVLVERGIIQDIRLSDFGFGMCCRDEQRPLCLGAERHHRLRQLLCYFVFSITLNQRRPEYRDFYVFYSRMFELDQYLRERNSDDPDSFEDFIRLHSEKYVDHEDRTSLLMMLILEECTRTREDCISLRIVSNTCSYVFAYEETYKRDT